MSTELSAQGDSVSPETPLRSYAQGDSVSPETPLRSCCWLALDAGASRIRGAAVLLEGGRARLLAPATSELFESAEGPERAEQAAKLLLHLAQQQGWQPPFQLALAWAGAPSSDGRGIVAARYGPAIPDLVDRLQRWLPLRHQPVLQSDARAALQGTANHYGFRSGYALISGTGLGEAYYQDGATWSRELFRQRLGVASQWSWQGLDGESWLRASAWRDLPLEPYLEALGQLLQWRLEQIQPEVIVLGGHFQEWFDQGWLGSRNWGQRLLSPPAGAALSGCVTLEQRRIQDSSGLPAG